MSRMEEINEICKRSFKTHKATLIQNTDRYLAIDWRRSDGSGEYYVNYIVDKKRGSLIVSGDLGDSIATWYNQLDPANLKVYVKDIGYYISKFQASSDCYCFETENILADLKDDLDTFEDDCVIIDTEIHSIDEFWKMVEEEVDNCIYGDKFIPSDSLNYIFEEIGCTDTFEWLYGCGRRIKTRVYLWAEGFRMACEQLGI